MIEIEFECISGSARVYSSRNADPVVLRKGQKLSLPVADLPNAEIAETYAEATEERRAEMVEFIKKNFASAWNAPGIGVDRRNSGQVSATPRGCGMVIRQYIETNAFLEPNEPDHVDHVAVNGEPVLANVTRANVVTLMPIRPV